MAEIDPSKSTSTAASCGCAASGSSGAGSSTRCSTDYCPTRTTQFTLSAPGSAGFANGSIVVPAPTSPWSCAASLSRPCVHCTAVPLRAFVLAGGASWYPSERSLLVMLPAAPDAAPALKTRTRTSARGLALPALVVAGWDDAGALADVGVGAVVGVVA